MSLKFAHLRLQESKIVKVSCQPSYRLTEQGSCSTPILTLVPLSSKCRICWSFRNACWAKKHRSPGQHLTGNTGHEIRQSEWCKNNFNWHFEARKKMPCHWGSYFIILHITRIVAKCCKYKIFEAFWNHHASTLMISCDVIHRSVASAVAPAERSCARKCHRAGSS